MTQDQSQPALSQPRILIVDDTPTNLKVLERMLRDEYRVTLALSGEEALQAVEYSRFDLILLDIMMPGMDGLETLRRMKASQQFHDTPVIFLTASHELAHQREGLELGASDYIVKPYERDIVLLRMRNILQRTALQSRLELAITGSGLGFWSCDVDSGLVHFDASGNEELRLNLTTGEVGAIGWASICHPEDIGRIHAALHQCRASHAQRLDVEVRLRDLTGDWIWFDLHGRPDSRGNFGSPRELAGTYRNIDARKRSDLARFESEERLRHVLIASDKGIWDWQISSDRMLVSPGLWNVLRMTANPAEDTLRMADFESRFPAAWLSAFQESLQQLQQRGHDHFRLEHQIHAGDGEVIWVSTHARVVSRDAEGKPQRIVGSIADITERIASLGRIIALMGELDEILTLSPDGIVYFDEQRQIKHINRSCEQLIGVNAGEISGMSAESFIHRLLAASDPTQPMPNLSGLIAGEDSSGKIVHLSQPQPRVLQLHWQSPGDGSSVALYLRDITRESEVDRMKSEFLTTAAHELRTPMASILGFTELLLKRDFTPERQKDMLDTIYRQAKRLTQLIAELLDLARIEARAGKDFVLTKQSITPIIRDAVAALNAEFYPNPMQVDLPDSLPELEIDASKLQQAIINVLSNAHKYSPGGGDIAVDILREESSHAGRIGIRVRDQGLGMTEAQLARVFERFYRADPSQNIPGTGLGMSLVKEIMQWHGGSVSIESTPSVGTTVILWLPLERQALPEKRTEGVSKATAPGDVTLWLNP